MVNKSFNAQIKLIIEGFCSVNKNFEKVFNLLKIMDDKLDDPGSVKHRVDYIENTLNIQPVKK